MIILGTNSIKDTGYDVDNSCRFNDGDSPRMHKTPGSAGNLTTWTLSMWVKRSTLGGEQLVAHGYADSSNQTEIMFEDNNSFTFRNKSSGSFDIQKNTNMKFRDLSAWYNIIIVNKASAQKLFINGVQPTYNTDVTGSYSTTWNNANENAIGSRTGGGSHFDGYICEVVFLDGTAVDDATSFGEFDSDSGIWKPIDVSGLTFGTNGFYLDFEDSSALGDDVSGNNNDFTVNNLTAIDQSTDTCTNNSCVVNALSKGSSIVLSEGNTKITKSSGFQSCMATIMPSTGKWYWENKVISLGTVNAGVTKSTQDGTTHSSVDAGRSMYSSNGTIYNEGLSASNISTGTTFTTNDIIGVALDIDGNTIKFYKNGTLIDTVSDSGISSAEGWSPAWGLSNGSFNVNFGSPSFTISSGNTDADGYGNFEYAVPSGYYALNTKNLAEYG